VTQVWFNGAFLDERDARLSIADRGFTLADGIFETLLGLGERPVWLAEHLRRLREGASQLGLHVAFDDQTLECAVVDLLRRNGFTRSAVRITLTRGPAAKRGLWVDDRSLPTLLITCAPSSVPGPQRVVIARSTRRNEHSPLSRIKSLNYGDSILARREALSRGATDALMLNGQGQVVCATVGNLFARVGTQWITPPVTDGILPGIAREKIIMSGVDVKQAALSEVDLRAADAAFISNSLGSADIVEIEGVKLNPCLAELPVSALYK